MHCIMANVLQTKVDAQYDKLVTELRWSMFSSYSKLFVKSHQLSHLHASVGVTSFEFCRDLQHQKIRVSGLFHGTVCIILRLAILVECQLVINRQTQLWHIPH